MNIFSVVLTGFVKTERAPRTAVRKPVLQCEP